jgi:hypothetical protein
MSVRISLHCNTVHGLSACAQSLMTDALTIGEARTIAAAYGWRANGGTDYCAACSGVRGRPRVILAHGPAGLTLPQPRPDELLQAAESTLLALVNRATPGRWTYRPPTGIRWTVSQGTAPGAELVAGGTTATDCVALTGPAGHPQAAADAAYIATVNPDFGRAVTAVLHEAYESVHQEGGLVQDSLSQAAVDLAAAIHRPTPQELQP